MKSLFFILFLFIYGIVHVYSRPPIASNKGKENRVRIYREKETATFSLSFMGHSAIGDKVDCPNRHWNSVVVDDVRFLRPFKLDHSSFNKLCLFNNGKTYPDNGEGVQFDSGVSLKDDTFNCKADFRNNTFLKLTEFSNTTFNNDVDFTYSEFNYETDFYQVLFNKGCHFVNARLNSDLDFNGATFCKVAFFSSLKFDNPSKGALFFTQAVLPDTIDFSDNQYLPRQVEFTDANFDKDSSNLHYIYLNRTDISKIHIDYLHFRLCFISPQTHRELSQEEMIASYEGLLKSFKDHGQTVSYEKLDVEYKDWQSKHDRWMRINGLWWNYGYKKARVVLWTFGFIILFSIINIWLRGILFPQNESEKAPIKKYLPKPTVSFADKLSKYKSSLFFTVPIFLKRDINFEKINMPSLFALFVIVFEYVTVLLCTGCLLNWAVTS